MQDPSGHSWFQYRDVLLKVKCSFVRSLPQAKKSEFLTGIEVMAFHVPVGNVLLSVFNSQQNRTLTSHCIFPVRITITEHCQLIALSSDFGFRKMPS